MKTIKVKCLSLANKEATFYNDDGNQRKYSIELIQKAIDDIQPLIDEKRFFATDKYPTDSTVLIGDIIGVVTKLEILGSALYATIELLETDAMKNWWVVVEKSG